MGTRSHTHAQSPTVLMEISKWYWGHPVSCPASVKEAYTYIIYFTTPTLVTSPYNSGQTSSLHSLKS